MPGKRPHHIARCIAAPLLMRTFLAGPCTLLVLSGVVLPTVAWTQQAPARVVQGKVLLGDGSMAKGAIVYLKNAKTLEVRTYISTDDGSYRFGQLSSDANYTVWAEYQGRKSKEKGVSSFDTKKVFEITLKIEA
jgi:Carboxypeptidase regulatory-like domain